MTGVLYKMPETTTPSISLRERTAIGLKEKQAMLTEGEWISITALVSVTLVAALVVAIFTYYLITDSFSTIKTGSGASASSHVGKFADLGWVSTGSGLLLLFFTTLFATLAGGAVGLGFKGKSGSLAASVGVAILVSIVLYWAFDAAVASRSFQVMLWAVIATVGGVILAAGGWKMSKELAAEEKGNALAESRSKYSLYMLVGAVVAALVLLLAFWNIHKHSDTS